MCCSWPSSYRLVAIGPCHCWRVVEEVGRVASFLWQAASYRSSWPGKEKSLQEFENMHLKHVLEEHRLIGKLLNLIDGDEA